MGLTDSDSPIFSGLGPCGYLWWMATWKQLIYSRLWCAHAKDGVVVGIKRGQQHQGCRFLSFNTTSEVVSRRSTVSLSYIIHQGAITNADRTGHPRRLWTSCLDRGQSDLAARLNSLRSGCSPSATEHVRVHTAYWRPWGFTGRRELRINVKWGVLESSR